MLPFASTIVFDVEGTLIDCAGLTLECWAQTLARHDFAFSSAELHPYSGLDGRLMLKKLLQTDDESLVKMLLDEQDKHYRNDYLQRARAFAYAPAVCAELAERGYFLALASSCQPDELRHYLKLLDISEFVTAVVSGADVRREKPAPDIIKLAVEGVPRVGRSEIWAIGDTPYDAEAALAADAVPIGTLSGGFSERELLDAGCVSVVADLRELTDAMIRTQDDGQASKTDQRRQALVGARHQGK